MNTSVLFSKFNILCEQEYFPHSIPIGWAKNGDYELAIYNNDNWEQEFSYKNSFVNFLKTISKRCGCKYVDLEYNSTFYSIYNVILDSDFNPIFQAILTDIGWDLYIKKFIFFSTKHPIYKLMKTLCKEWDIHDIHFVEKFPFYKKNMGQFKEEDIYTILQNEQEDKKCHSNIL